ncbi:MAG: huyB [Gammaproteobacteria bacterium]|jgi:N-methylhydantoinase B|nr:huyB [Gammaproteobacteria bacterium]
MSTTDPYTIEIIRSSLEAIGDEMFSALQRTSMSPIIYETLDFSVGVTDARGDLITQGNGTTVFLAMIDSLVRDILAKFGSKGEIHPGDVFMSNDPYEGGGTHLSDFGLVAPVFHQDELVAFVVNKAHWVDVGGKNPGSFSTNATEIFQEGIQVPSVKIIARGAVNEQILEIITANIRLPKDSMGDFWAGVAANRVGERRIVELFAKYGRDAVLEAKEQLLTYGETMIQKDLAALPKGVFTAEDWIDDDGITSSPLRVQVKVTITDDEFVADFTGSAPQAQGPINNSRTGLVSAVRMIFKALTNPHIPANAGCFRMVRVICPDSTVFTAKRPAPVSTYWETQMYAVDLIWKALAPHVPQRLTAGHQLSVCAVILAGTHADTKEFALLVCPLVGGWGAGISKDGESGQFSAADGETYNIPVEITEARYGVLVEQYAFHNAAGGAGEYRGGRGVVMDYRVRTDDFVLTGSFGRFKYPPWSMNGGQNGSPNMLQVLRADGTTETYGKIAGLPLKKGDVVRMITAHGGGVGDPKKRPIERIREDLHNGFITPEQVQRDYGLSV